MHNRLSAGIRPHTFISDNYAFVAPAVGSFELKKKTRRIWFFIGPRTAGKRLALRYYATRLIVFPLKGR